MKRMLIKFFSLVLLMSMIFSPAIAQTPGEKIGPTLLERKDFEPVGPGSTTSKYIQVEPDRVIRSDEPTRYIVLFEGDSLVATSGGAGELNVNSIQSQNYLDTLATKRNAVLTDVEKSIGRSVQINHVYDVILNGVSVELSPSEAAQLESLPGIRRVMKDTTETLDTDAGPTWIGADGIWDGSAVPDTIGNKGEGILVGMIDSGINFDHPSFSDTPADGFTYSWTGD